MKKINGTLISWIRTAIRKNRARSFVKNAKAWKETSQAVSVAMDNALHDPSIAEGDIGYLIDQVDRMLLHLGFYFSDSMGILKRRNPELARRFERASQQVIVVRNKMTIFLIRSQGPGPMSGEEPDEETRNIYYYRALDEVGFYARDLMAELDRQLTIIWMELQQVINQEEALVMNR
jgi:hypothetical protein